MAQRTAQQSISSSLPDKQAKEDKTKLVQYKILYLQPV